MKTKFYLLTIFTFITLVVSAQFPRYNTMLSEEWADNAWVNSMKSVNTYDANGNLTGTVHQQWDTVASEWTNAINIIHTLNTDGTVMETVSQVWEADEWQEMQKTTYTYSPTKKVLTENTQLNMEGILLDWSKVTNTYDDKDSLETRLLEVINLLTMQMTNSSLDTYTYNPDGTENQLVSQSWNPETSAWENSTRYTNTYDDARKIISDLTETWTDNAWVNELKSTYTYDGEQLQESLDQEWETDQWTDAYKYLYSYMANNQLHQLVSQQWNAESSQWVNESRITFTYGSTGINPVADQSLVAFPNPFKDQITIQSGVMKDQNIDIINSSGQVVKSFKTQGKALKMDLGHLENGMYFIRMNSPESKQSIKVLKVK
ncbi:MAG TPA: T9SS type A sorting domain-containing protein [Prolixibacteraceae bacterium]|nr:T9SS type A sorting domain-containing protein [Prolixibacteraceae bacterium]